MNKETSSKPQGDIILREHTYDGIQEYDQKLPNWWLFTLYIMMVFFVIYWFAYYQLPLGMKSDQEKIESQVASLAARRENLLKELLASISDQSLMEMSRDPGHVAAGKSIFQTKCVACHGSELNAEMGGIKLPGVNLVDAEWKYGGNPLSIMKTVTEGSPDLTKGMIAWKKELPPTDIARVVAYVLSRQPPTYPVK